MKLFLATGNAHKIQEIQEILKPYPLFVRTRRDFPNLPEVPETGTTFTENAVLKAIQTAKWVGLPSLSDDSGLVVDALQGAPGVHSARYAGVHATDKERCEKLLSEMEGQENRTAYFECVIALATPEEKVWTWSGRCDGLITTSLIGANGFGYDSIFWLPECQKTFAQLTATEKNQISHRARALMAFQTNFPQEF